MAEFDLDIFLKTLTARPGIYKMLDSKGEILYVGKARNLKNRVRSYFRVSTISPKISAMLTHLDVVEVTITSSESEALLLESQLIKRYKPRYNITLRDDKSYPYIYLSTPHAFPQVTFHRGAKKRPGRYFGPFPSAGAVRESLKLLQKVFPVRQCDDTFYNNRSRPCLQHQIERCTAPCVSLVSAADYQQDLDHTIMFLEGNSHLLIDELVGKMEQASSLLEYEKAARYRNQIQKLRVVLEKQFVAGENGNADIIACASEGGMACVQVFFIRNGQQLGNKAFFPKMNVEHEPRYVLQAFISQYYLDRQIPNDIIISHSIKDIECLTLALKERSGHSVNISSQVRGERLKWLQLGCTNADNALQSRLASKQNILARFVNLQQELRLKDIPERIECFDISHLQGEQTVASCVVFDKEGPVKSAYRRFNIQNIKPGDDYAAIYQAVLRRYNRIKKGEYPEPDLLLIDGGQGQINAAEKALKEIGINNVKMLGVSKGPDRKPGMEKLLMLDRELPVNLSPGASCLLLIQQVRDEAHRFAISGHRNRRSRARKKSTLEVIAGLGPKRRQKLLKEFGGLQGVSKAGVEALYSVHGVSRQLAERIYETFHQQDA